MAPLAANMPNPSRLVLLLAGTVAGLPAQIEWVPVRAMPTEASMVLDEARECVVLAGDAIPGERDFVTWEWGRADWRDCSSAGAPVAWTTSRLVYDRARQRVLRVASEIGSTQVTETWAYDGAAWTQLHPAAQPTPRHFFALAHDPVRQRTVLFGGFGFSSQHLDDTWEYDGATWTQVMTAVRPPRRLATAMAYDEARHEIVLFGGFGNPVNNQLADTWRYDGTNWQQVTPATIPPARAQHAMAYDRSTGRVVMFGGTAPDTWEWDGSNWTLANPIHSPPARFGAAMATHPNGGVLLYGGYFQRTDLWRYANGEWYCYHDHHMLREQSGDTTMTYDTAREAVVWVGNGLESDMETWRHDGRYWQNESPAGIRPPSRFDTAIAFDPLRAVTVLFGGGTSGGTADDTWAWNGAAWTQATPAIRPPARRAHAIAFDPSSQRMLLFGGADAQFSPVPLGDTWSFDGVSWQQHASAVAPSARFMHGMATDSLRGRVLLFGGTNLTTRSDETWEFANGAWNQLAPPVRPSARMSHAMAFDSKRDRLVMHGGWLVSSAATDTWEFDGVTWSQLATPPLQRQATAMVYDSRSDAMWLKGTFASGGFNGAFHLARDPLASGTTYGIGCSSNGPPPQLSASSTAYFGNHEFQIGVRGAPGAISLLVLGLIPGAVPIQGCTLLIAPPFGLRANVANSFGFAPFSQQVPLAPELRGVHLYFQAGQFDPLAGSFDFTAGLDLRLGG